MQVNTQDFLYMVSNCTILRNSTPLQEFRDSLSIERQNLDRWFDRYLEKFERQMSTSDTDTPIWKLYKSKYEEYSTINEYIRQSDRHIKNI